MATLTSVTAAERLLPAALTVFDINIAIVIGPTPPGTGVIASAFFAHFVESDVAHQPITSLVARIFHAIDSDVDHTAPSRT